MCFKQKKWGATIAPKTVQRGLVRLALCVGYCDKKSCGRRSRQTDDSKPPNRALACHAACGEVLKSQQESAIRVTNPELSFFAPFLPTLKERLHLTATIDYYFTPQSPWTYLGHARFTEMARQAGATVRVLPVDFGKVFSISGGLPLANARRSGKLTAWSS